MNKQELSEKLFENHQKFADFVSCLSEQDFMFAPENKWTAGQQLEHIVRGVSPVKMALTLPKFIPGLLFGKAKRDSIDYETLVKKYQGKLAAGSKASGRFIPPEIGFDKRENLKNKMMKTVAELTKKIEKFSEAQLDEYVLPHPILGKLTIREMLYFTVYHVEHHHQTTLKNLKIKFETEEQLRIEAEQSFKWGKVKNGLPHCARIILYVEKSNKNEIIEEYSGKGFYDQGCIEVVSSEGYRNWKDGVKNGLNYAFSKMDDNWQVRVKKLEGLTTDTNSTITGYVAIRAFWEKIGYQADEKEIEKLESFVFKSWVNDNLTPDFFNLKWD